MAWPGWSQAELNPGQLHYWLGPGYSGHPRMCIKEAGTERAGDEIWHPDFRCRHPKWHPNCCVKHLPWLFCMCPMMRLQESPCLSFRDFILIQPHCLCLPSCLPAPHLPLSYYCSCSNPSPFPSLLHAIERESALCGNRQTPFPDSRDLFYLWLKAVWHFNRETCYLLSI